MSNAPVNSHFGPGLAVSFVLHLVLGLVVIFVLERARNNAPAIQQIFSVTIEGGTNLGSISQVPKDGAKKILTPEANKEVDPTPEKDPTEKLATKVVPDKGNPPEKQLEDIKSPTAVEEDRKLKLKLLEDEKKKIEQKKKEEELKKKAELDKKKQLEEEKKKEEEKQKEEDEKKKQKDKQLRDKQLEAALQKLKQRYEGESADAGGKGFGAATLGGKGMGGGTLTSIEKLAYSNKLQAHVKQGWRWLNSSERLVAKIQVSIAEDGRVTNSRIIQSSGSSNFDDSVIRAVEKSSPVPAPPTDLFQDFKTVVFTFDSAE